MSTKPLLSVISPVYNREKYISECIDSILNQSFDNFEFIIIDDCSNDMTFDIIEKYKSKDNRIKVIRNKKNIGATLSFNKGLEISSGKYIARMDSDDISLPQRFEKQIDIFEKWDNLDVLGAGAILINSNGKEIGRKKFPSDFKKIKKILMSGVPVFDPSVIIKSEIIKKLGGLDDRLAPADDYHLWLTVFKEKKIISNLDEYLIKYRIHETNLSKIQLSEQLKKTFVAKKIFLSDLDIDNFFEKKEHENLKNIEKIIYKKWKSRETNIEDINEILKEYFSLKEFNDDHIRNKIPVLIQTLFLKKKYLLFIKYLIQYLVSSFRI